MLFSCDEGSIVNDIVDKSEISLWLDSVLKIKDH